MKKILLFLEITILYCFLIFSINCNNNFVASLDIGATCEGINPSSKCVDYLGYSNIYIPNGVTQLEIEVNVTYALTNFNAISEVICKENAIKLYCITTYRECNSNITGITFPLPSNPCKKNCDTVMETCAIYVAFLGFSCLQNDTDGQNLYPDIENYYNLTSFGGNLNQGIECSNPSIGSQNTTVSCVYPLVYVSTDEINDRRRYHEVMPNCVLPCPLSVYTDKQERVKFYSEATLYSISAFISCYLIFTFGVIPNKITHRGLIIVYLGVTCLSLCASYAVQEAKSLSSVNDDWRCTSDPGRYKSSLDSTCMLTGFFFQVGGMGIIFFLSLYAFDFFLTINMRTNKYFLQTSLVIWGLIFFFALLPIKHYESSIASAGCWISDENNMFWQYFCFYVPVYLATFLMVIFVVSSIYKVFKMTILFKSINDKRILFLNLRSIAFLVIILWCITFSTMYPLYVSYNGDDYMKAVETWIYCLLEFGDSQCPSVVFPQFNLRYMNAFCMAVIGVLGLIGLGIDPHVVAIYKESERFGYLLNLVGIKWGATPPTSKQGSNTTDSSSGGSNGPLTPKQLSINEKKQLRKSRGASVQLKKVNLDQFTTPGNDDDTSSSPNNIIIDNNNDTTTTSIIPISNNNNDNNNNNDSSV